MALPVTARAQGATEAQLTPPPSPSYVWMSGHWNSVSGQWTWVAAHWELPSARNALWIGGHWASQGGSWVWINGAWNVSESPQSQVSPPQPPSQALALSTAAPSTPPPLYDESTAADGTVRGVQMIPMTTDYGPIDYSVVEPAYGWAGDPYWSTYPLYWGYPGAFVGLGWGPAYFDYYGGRGYWGHGYSGGGVGWRGGDRGRGDGGRGRGGHAGGGAPVRGGTTSHSDGGRPGGNPRH